MASGLRSPVSLGFSWDLGVEAVKRGAGQVLRATVDPHIPQGGGRWLRDNAGGGGGEQVQRPWLAQELTVSFRLD